MERLLDVNSALLHISILMEHRGAWGYDYDKRMADDPIYCLSDKFFPSYWFPISMSQIYHPSQDHHIACKSQNYQHGGVHELIGILVGHHSLLL